MESKKQLSAIFGLRNISLIYRMYISFAIVIIFFAISAVVTSWYQTTIKRSYEAVEKEAQPLVAKSADVNSALLTAHQRLLVILSLRTTDEINSALPLFQQRRDELLAQVSELEAMASNSPALNAAEGNQELKQNITALSAKVNEYLQNTNNLADILNKYYESQKMVNNKQADLQNLLDMITQEVSRSRAYWDDPFIDRLSDEFMTSLNVLKQSVFRSFKMEQSKDILESFYGNQLNIKDLRAKFESLVEEVIQLVDNVESIYLMPLYKACEERDGVFYQSYLLALEKENVARVTAESEQTIAEAQAIITKIHDGINDFSNIASDEVRSSIAQSIGITVVSIIIVIVTVIVVCVSLGTSIKTPMSYLMNVMHKAADGDLTHSYNDPAHDEFTQIGASLNTMIDQTRSVVEKLIVQVNDLKATAEENAAIVDESNEAVDIQRKEAFMVASSTAELEQTLAQVVESSQRTLDEVVNVGKVSEESRMIMSDNITTTHTLDSKLKETSEAITQVNKMGDNIGSVVTTIRGIAEQTNLLALNAAIEAARAGEYGRGFAVVADEVRTLANRTSDATKEIVEVIEQLRSTISKAVNVIQSCNEEMASSLEQSSKANSSIEEIMGNITSIDSMTAQIVESAHEQEIATREINKNITRISELSEQNCEGMNRIKNSSAELDRIAAEQSEIINKFKV